jgi:hypothetical protein
LAGHGKKDCDEQLILALAAGAGVAAAAQQAHVSEQTVRRRLGLPGFRERISEMRSQLVADAVGRLAILGTIAADELHRLIRQGENDQVKLGAARAVLGYMLAGHGNEILARQVEELRRQMEAIEHGTGDSSQPGAPAARAAAHADGEGGADPRAHPPGPHDADDGSGSATGPVAAGAADDDEDIKPLFA